MKRVFFVPLLGLALAQVNLVDGPRPASEVRGYLEGNAAQGYRVRVEFLVETGGNPTTGTLSPPLGWDGRFSACAPDCTTFRLVGWSPGGVYNGSVFPVQDSQGRERGRAGVTTQRDQAGRPTWHQVEYALWPAQAQRTWQPSPDGAVPLEAGGWLWARPPGGSPERYRYPGMEGYQPPGGGSVLSGISPADRDLAQKTLIDSLVKLRAFYDRQVSGGELWFFVPEVSPWTFTLAQEWTSRRGGAVRYVVPEGTAASYCPTSYRNDTRFRVMPRGSLSKDQSIAVIWPPRNASQKGAVMAGRFLVDRPDWQETDYVNITTALIPMTSGLPEARATVWGYYSQANLQARVEFREVGLGQVEYVAYRQYEGAWDGSDTFELGAGAERITLPVSSSLPSSWVQVGPARDGAGRDRGLAQVLRQVTRQWQLDPGQTQNLTYTYELWRWNDPIAVSFQTDVGAGTETFYLRGCSWDESTQTSTCEVRDESGRYRGQATAQRVALSLFKQWWEYRLTLYRWRVVEQVRWQVYWYLSRWQTTWRPARDNDRPVEPGGFVVAEGRRYRVPGLEGYLMPTGRDLEAVEGDPYVTYITRQLLPDKNPYAPLGGQVPDKDTWYKPLSTWCQEKGL